MVNVVKATLGGRRGNTDDRVFARAMPEKVEISETYSVTQEISQYPTKDPGPCNGRVEMMIPYDGGDYFTRQAVGDVERALAARGSGTPRQAIMGHLVIADHRQTDLHQYMQQYGEVGVIPLKVPVTSADGTTGQLTSDRRTSVLRYDYTPMPPELDPVELEVRLFDPDILDLELDWVLDAFRVDPAHLIKRITQEARFKSELLLMIKVRLVLPVKQGQVLKPVVKRISLGWPTVTSIETTQLAVLAPGQNGTPQDTQQSGYQPWPIRYNPVERRLEWEDVHFAEPERPAGDAGPEERPDEPEVTNRSYESAPMRLIIGHPGELFQADRLTVHAEVEVPGYLLSGTEARLYGATGNRVPDDRDNPLPELKTHLNADASLQLDDAFAKREFAPYHQVVFDEVVPAEARIDDIVTVLKMAQFDVKKPRKDETAEPDSPKWVLRASRPQDSMTLTIAVEGRRHPVEEHVVEQARVGRRQTRDTGWIKLSVRGVLARDHKKLTKQMNELQAALRERYRQHQQEW